MPAVVSAILAIASAIGALAEIAAAATAIIAILTILFDPKGSQKVGWLFGNIVSGTFKVASVILGQVEKDLAPTARAFLESVQRNGGPLISELTGPFKTIASTAFNDLAGKMEAMGESQPNGAVNRAAEAIGNAYGFGMSSAAVTALFEACFPEKLNTFNGAGAILAEMAGFKEVSSKVLEPLYHNAFGKSLEYHYRSLFKPELPDEADAVQWHSRRLLTDDQLRTIFGYSGLKTEYETAFITSAYRSIQPRALTTLFEDQPFPRDDVRGMLEFYGARDHDISILLQAYEYNSTKNVRHQYLSALLTAAERGTIDEATLDSHLTTLNFSDQAKNYVQLTVSIRRLEQLAELYRKSVTQLYETGQLTDAQYVPALEAIGINQADADAHYGVDSARLHGKEIAAQIRAQEKLAAATLREQIGAIRALFMAA